MAKAPRFRGYGGFSSLTPTGTRGGYRPPAQFVRGRVGGGRSSAAVSPGFAGGVNYGASNPAVRAFAKSVGRGPANFPSITPRTTTVGSSLGTSGISHPSQDPMAQAEKALATLQKYNAIGRGISAGFDAPVSTNPNIGSDYAAAKGAIKPKPPGAGVTASFLGGSDPISASGPKGRGRSYMSNVKTGIVSALNQRALSGSQQSLDAITTPTKVGTVDIRQLSGPGSLKAATESEGRYPQGFGGVFKGLSLRGQGHRASENIIKGTPLAVTGKGSAPAGAAPFKAAGSASISGRPRSAADTASGSTPRPRAPRILGGPGRAARQGDEVVGGNYSTPAGASAYEEGTTGPQDVAASVKAQRLAATKAYYSGAPGSVGVDYATWAQGAGQNYPAGQARIDAYGVYKRGQAQQVWSMPSGPAGVAQPQSTASATGGSSSGTTGGGSGSISDSRGNRRIASTGGFTSGGYTGGASRARSLRDSQTTGQMAAAIKSGPTENAFAAAAARAGSSGSVTVRSLNPYGASRPQSQQQAERWESWNRNHGGSSSGNNLVTVGSGGTLPRAGAPSSHRARYAAGTTRTSTGGLSFSSDARLKHNIKPLGMKGDVPWYEFSYIGQTERHEGTMAQDLIGTRHEHAVGVDSEGFYMVNYGRL